MHPPIFDPRSTVYSSVRNRRRHTSENRGTLNPTTTPRHTDKRRLHGHTHRPPLRDKGKARIWDLATKLRAARRYNSKPKPRSFHKGDLVWRMASKARKHEGKFSPNWEGPFRVLKEVSKGAYRLEKLSGEPLPNTWNISHLKFYFS